MRKIKNIKVKVVKKPEIYIGDHFIYKDIEWVCLDIIDGNYLAITAKVWKELLPFDDSSNNWEKSSLRKMLNNNFLNNFNKNNLILQTSDLTADNGDKSYGTCKDYVTILSCDQYRKYKDLVPCYSDWIWTLTPQNCYNYKGCRVRGIHPTGYFNNYDNHTPNGIAPVCLFSSKILKSPDLFLYSEIKSIKKILE